ncbi:MAG: hypothetical protein ACJ746_06755 [Bryobacteraceae bacterium]
MNPVALIQASAGSHPTGTGSFSYSTGFSVLVDNLAFTKQVQILGHDRQTGSWAFHPCSFSFSVAGNGEIWGGSVFETLIDQFVIQYDASGNIFFDNNSGFNYLLDVQAGEGTDGTGTIALNSNVQANSWDVDVSGNLIVNVLVKNLAFAKQVGIRYTTDNWATFHDAFGVFRGNFPPFGSPHQPNAESWSISAFVGVGKHGQFAVFYSVNGSTFWDNNFGANNLF